MVTLSLSRGFSALVDDEDLPLLEAVVRLSLRSGVGSGLPAASGPRPTSFYAYRVSSYDGPGTRWAARCELVLPGARRAKLTVDLHRLVLLGGMAGVEVVLEHLERAISGEPQGWHRLRAQHRHVLKPLDGSFLNAQTTNLILPAYQGASLARLFDRARLRELREVKAPPVEEPASSQPKPRGLSYDSIMNILDRASTRRPRGSQDAGPSEEG